MASDVAKDGRSKQSTKYICFTWLALHTSASAGGVQAASMSDLCTSLHDSKRLTVARVYRCLDIQPLYQTGHLQCACVWVRRMTVPEAADSLALAAAACSASRTFFMASLANFMWNVLPCSCACRSAALFCTQEQAAVHDMCNS